MKVHDEERSSKLAQSTSVPFGADKPLICHSEKRYERKVTDFVASQTLCMHAIATEAWACRLFQHRINFYTKFLKEPHGP